MRYTQLTSNERYMISALRKQGHSTPEIAENLGRHRSTIWREIRRNSASYDGFYRPSKAVERTSGRRSRSRRNRHFSQADFEPVKALLSQQWSPEQISGRMANGRSISHETIYRYIWADKEAGGKLYQHLRCAAKKKRKRYGRYDSRGRLAGKRHITERPKVIEPRQQVGHWEIDTVMGSNDLHCILTLVERKTGYTLIGKLNGRTQEAAAASTIQLIRDSGLPFKSITSDNGTEFHSYQKVEEATGVKYYFANPHHAWERGTNENTNGLIRQYLPKRRSMMFLTQARCEVISTKLNNRPRKRHGFKTPKEMMDEC